MNRRRHGLTVLELLIIIILVVVAAVVLIRMNRSPGTDAAPSAPADSALLAPPGSGNALIGRLAFLTPFDSIATVGDTVEVRVRATTDAGTGVAQADIRFEVSSGGGQVTADSAVTNDQGEASVGWILGPTPGEQLIQASVGTDGVVPVTLSLRTVAPGAGSPAGSN